MALRAHNTHTAHHTHRNTRKMSANQPFSPFFSVKEYFSTGKELGKGSFASVRCAARARMRRIDD